MVGPLIKESVSDIIADAEDRLSSQILVTTGDLDELDNLDEQIALFACLLALLIITLLSAVAAVVCLVLSGLYIWGRFSLSKGAFTL